MSGAFRLAWSGAFFRNSEGTGDGLGVFFRGCLSLLEALIIFIGQRNGADIGTLTAGRTFGRINIAGVFSDQNSEMTFRTLDLIHLGAGDEVDVGMPADLDQFRGDDSHSAIIGGEGLIKFRHDPANGCRFLQEVNSVPGIGQIQCRLHPGNAPSHNKDGSNLLFLREMLLFRV